MSTTATRKPPQRSSAAVSQQKLQTPGRQRSAKLPGAQQRAEKPARVQSIRAQAAPANAPTLGHVAMIEWAKQLAKARLAPRCHHRKADGVRCGSPALHGRRFCYFHNRLRVRRDAPLNYLPPLEDANGIQSAIMEVARALLQNKIDRKTAGLLFYALQTASANLKHPVK